MIGSAAGGRAQSELVPVPALWRLHLDPGSRRLERGSVLLGGVPLRLFRLGPRAARHVAAWCEGAPVADRPGARRLARRLLDAGLLHPDPPSRLPAPGEVTVVVPVRDRAAALERCLAGLRCGPPVVVVDDASADPTSVARVAMAAGARVVRREVNGGPGAARNVGAAACASPLVAFVDSDCVPCAGWLDRLLGHFDDPAVGAVAPRIVALGSLGPLAAYERERSALDMGPREAAARPCAGVPYVPSTALVVRRSAFGDGFQETMRVGEDVDLVWRLVEAGWTVRYDPAVSVAHDHRAAPVEWVRTRVRYNAAAGDLARRHPGAIHAAHASRWSLLAWAALLAGRPLAAAGSAGVAAFLLRRRLGRRLEQPGATALGIVARGMLADGRSLARAVRGPWLPFALLAGTRTRAGRRVLVASFFATPLAEWLAGGRRLGPLTYLVARDADDVARGLGVWVGCSRHGTVAPLLPRIGITRAAVVSAAARG